MSKYLINTQNYIYGCTPPDTAQTGAVFFDSNCQSMVVYNGSSWIKWEAPAPILTVDAENTLDQMIRILDKNKELSALSAKYPIVEQALGQLIVALKLCENLDIEDK